MNARTPRRESSLPKLLSHSQRTSALKSTRIDQAAYSFGGDDMRFQHHQEQPCSVGGAVTTPDGGWAQAVDTGAVVVVTTYSSSTSRRQGANHSCDGVGGIVRFLQRSPDAARIGSRLFPKNRLPRNTMHEILNASQRVRPGEH